MFEPFPLTIDNETYLIRPAMGQSMAGRKLIGFYFVFEGKRMLIETCFELPETEEDQKNFDWKRAKDLITQEVHDYLMRLKNERRSNGVLNKYPIRGSYGV